MTTETMTRAIVKLNKPIISKQICDALTDLVAKGNYNITACQIVGITEPTFYGWLNKGEQDTEIGIETLYSYLFKSLKKAEAQSEAEMMERVRSAAQPGVKSKKTKISPDGETVEINETSGDWLAAATYLERRHPDRWGRRDRTRVDINETKTVTITHVEVVLNEAGQTPTIEGESRELIEGKE